MTHIDQIPDL